MRFPESGGVPEKNPNSLTGKLLRENRMLELEKDLYELDREENEDHLTGLAGRRAFEKELGRSLALVRRELLPEVALISVDLDHFKRINDNFGHPSGDEVLKKVSAFLKDAVRSTDIVARVGGEEIMILLHGTSLSDATKEAEELRVGIMGLKFDECPEMVTASFGVISSRDSTDDKTLLRHVDRALYAAKNNGRNRIEKYDESMGNGKR